MSSSSSSGSGSNDSNHNDGCDCGCKDSVVEFSYVESENEEKNEDSVVEF